jgi:Cu2+-exporting ATPase
MFALFSLTAGRTSGLKRSRLLPRVPRARLIDALTDTPSPPLQRRVTTSVQQIHTTLLPIVLSIDSTYQRFVQTHIDPLFGRKRHTYMTLLAGENATQLHISQAERATNYHLGIGSMSLVAAGLGVLFHPLFTSVAIVLGLSVISRFYVLAYQQWKQTQKVGTVHLICIYLACLWLGGYATVGALSTIVASIAFKVKAIAEEQSRHNLLHLFQIQPSTVWIRHADGAEIMLPFEQLRVGDLLVLHAGQTVPVDGVIVAGAAIIDEHMLTGETQPVEKAIDEPVLASTVMLSGKIDVRVTRTGAETTAGQIVNVLNTATQYNTAHVNRLLTLTDAFALPTLAISVVSWPLLGTAGAVSLLGANMTMSTYLSNPLAMLNFLNRAADKGALIKNGAGLDALSQVDTIVFDKTGTLTLQGLHIVHISSLTERSADELLRLAAAAENRQTHPIAHAILAAAAERQLDLPPIDQAHYDVGYGLTLWLDQGVVRVGSQRFMDMESIAIPPAVEEIHTRCQAVGHTLVLVALDDELLGCIELQPTLRPEVEPIVAGLRQRNLSLYIVSGDQEAPTHKLADQLGMTGAFANMLPEDKATLVKQFQQEGRSVCFIGDGINDALAMRQANVSISLRGATSAATDTAQIILMDGSLNQLLELFVLAEGFEQNFTTNLRFTTATSLVAAGGIFLAGFTFAATQVLYIVSLSGSLGIAMKPVLEQRDE